jgi:hypothetical protein
VIDTDKKAYKGLSSRRVLESAPWAKNAKYLKSQLEQQHTFVPLSYLVNDMDGVEVSAFEKRISSPLMVRFKHEYSKLVGFVARKWHCWLSGPTPFCYAARGAKGLSGSFLKTVRQWRA